MQHALRTAAALGLAGSLISSGMTQSPAEGAAARAGTVRLVAWSTGSLPGGTEGALDRMAGVRATTVLAGSLFMRRSFDPAGHAVDRPPRGYRIPLDVAYIRPWGYRRFARPEERKAITSLRHGRALMARAEVPLRGDHQHLYMRTTVGRLHSVGRVSTWTAQGYEFVTPAPPPVGVQTLRTVLIDKDRDVPTARIRTRIRSLMAPGAPLRVVSRRHTSYLRYAESTAPLVRLKHVFGEFPMRFGTGGDIVIAPNWVSNHIRTGSVPVIGRVTCHRRLFPQLRGALAELRREGLGYLIRSYDGCYNSRVVTGGHQRISRHSWGIALDINASGNCFGCTPHQDGRLVRIMRRWGFVWGGTFPTPDGMHFEWRRFPH